MYTEVAALVREAVEKDAEKGSEKARLLLHEIDRKLVKQTVMTSVYGVTFVGARGQIMKRLRERGWEPPPKTNIDAFLLAHYAAKVCLSTTQQIC